MNWRSFASGVLGLVVLSTVVQDRAAGRVGGLFNSLAGLISRALDPNVPAIPDLRVASTSASTSTTTRSTSPGTRTTSTGAPSRPQPSDYPVGSTRGPR